MAEETRKKLLPGAGADRDGGLARGFGAFIDLGGVQGLVPLSELSHSRASRPADLLRVGDAVSVKVLRIDQEKGRISLSLKALEGDPWTAVAGRLRERQVVRGRAVRSTEFGVFVELLPASTASCTSPKSLAAVRARCGNPRPTARRWPC